MEFWLATTMINEVDELAPVAAAAEEAGFTGAAVADHVVIPHQLESKYPYSEAGDFSYSDIAWPDPWVAIGAMAAATEQLAFTTNVYILPLRNPFVVAKAISTAAAISGGRVRAGFGAGWMEEEFVALEQDFTNRGKRLEEMLDVLRTLWRGGMVEHRGEFYDFGPLEMKPAPPKPIPIYLGGATDVAIRRATQLCDGWIGLYYTESEVFTEIDRIRRALAAAGRDIDKFDINLSVLATPDPDLVSRLEAAGVNALYTVPWLMEGNFTPTLDEKRSALARFGEKFIAPLEQG